MFPIVVSIKDPVIVSIKDPDTSTSDIPVSKDTFRKVLSRAILNRSTLNSALVYSIGLTPMKVSLGCTVKTLKNIRTGLLD